MVLLLQGEKKFCILRESKIEVCEAGNEFGVNRSSLSKFSGPL